MVWEYEYLGYGGGTSIGHQKETPKQETEPTQDLVLPDRGKQEPSKVRALVLGVFTDYKFQSQDFKNGTADVLVHTEDQRKGKQRQLRIEYPREDGSILLRIPTSEPRARRDQMWDAFVAATPGPKAQTEVERDVKPHALIKVGRPVTREDVLDVAEELFGTRTLTQSGNTYRTSAGEMLQVDRTRIHVHSSEEIDEWGVTAVTERLRTRVVAQAPKRAPTPAQSTHPGTGATFRSGVTEELHGADVPAVGKKHTEQPAPKTTSCTLDLIHVKEIAHNGLDAKDVRALGILVMSQGYTLETVTTETRGCNTLTLGYRKGTDTVMLVTELPSQTTHRPHVQALGYSWEMDPRARPARNATIILNATDEIVEKKMVDWCTPGGLFASAHGRLKEAVGQEDKVRNAVLEELRLPPAVRARPTDRELRSIKLVTGEEKREAQATLRRTRCPW